MDSTLFAKVETDSAKSNRQVQRGASAHQARVAWHRGRGSLSSRRTGSLRLVLVRRHRRRRRSLGLRAKRRVGRGICVVRVCLLPLGLLWRRRACTTGTPPAPATSNDERGVRLELLLVGLGGVLRADTARLVGAVEQPDTARPTAATAKTSCVPCERAAIVLRPRHATDAVAWERQQTTKVATLACIGVFPAYGSAAAPADAGSLVGDFNRGALHAALPDDDE